MGRLRHTLVGLFAGIGLIAGGGSSDLLEPSPAQAKARRDHTHGSTDAHGL